jgi:hypothetical protein
MPQIHINSIAILVSVVAGFFLSYIWYTPLFGKLWCKEMGFDPNEKPPALVLIKSLLLTVLSVFLISFVLANNIGAWSPSSWGQTVNEISKFEQAFQAGFFTWVGFFFSFALRGGVGKTILEVVCD